MPRVKLIETCMRRHSVYIDCNRGSSTSCLMLSLFFWDIGSKSNAFDASARTALKRSLSLMISIRAQAALGMVLALKLNFEVSWILDISPKNEFVHTPR